MDPELTHRLLGFQKSEKTEYHIYSRLSRKIGEGENRRVLRRIADNERRHHGFWKRYTHREVTPNRVRVFWFVFIARIFGLNFGIKLLERGNRQRQVDLARVPLDEV